MSNGFSYIPWLENGVDSFFSDDCLFLSTVPFEVHEEESERYIRDIKDRKWTIAEYLQERVLLLRIRWEWFGLDQRSWLQNVRVFFNVILSPRLNIVFRHSWLERIDWFSVIRRFALCSYQWVYTNFDNFNDWICLNSFKINSHVLHIWILNGTCIKSLSIFWARDTCSCKNQFPCHNWLLWIS